MRLLATGLASKAFLLLLKVRPRLQPTATFWEAVSLRPTISLYCSTPVPDSNISMCLIRPVQHPLPCRQLPRKHRDAKSGESSAHIEFSVYLVRNDDPAS